MNIGLAKSAPQPQVSITTTQTVQQENVPVWDGVPLDVYKYMGVDFFEASDKHKEELRDIYSYASRNSNGMPGDIIQRLDELQSRLGQPPIGTSRLMQVSNYVRINKCINDMMKQKRALERGSRNI